MKRIVSLVLFIALLAVSFHALSESNPPQESVIILGSYEQDGNEENGPEPIEWIVLAQEDGRALLLSRYALDVIPYNEDYTLGPAWETCSLRTWLNNTFMNTAFSKSEQKCLLTTLVPNGFDQGHPSYSLVPQNDTVDYIFCPSYAEVKAYIPNESQRCTEPTPYATSKGVRINDPDNPNAEWWIRSPDDNKRLAATCNHKGLFYFGRYFLEKGICVRPAVQVDIKKIPNTIVISDSTPASAASHPEDPELLPTDELQRLYAEAENKNILNNYTFSSATPPAREENTIIELFPDKGFAKLIRDSLNKTSINAKVTQAELDSLTELSADDSREYQIQSLEGISRLRNLTGIDFSTNWHYMLYGSRYRIHNSSELVFVGAELPEEIGELKSLKNLRIKGINITKLPDSMRNLTELQTLVITDSTLSEIPEWIGDLRNLQTINFSKTFITSLPDSIGNLHNLNKLILTDTDVASLPDTICQLTNLRVLRLNYTPLTQLPEGIEQLELTELDITNTGIE